MQVSKQKVEVRALQVGLGLGGLEKILRIDLAILGSVVYKALRY